MKDIHTTIPESDMDSKKRSKMEQLRKNLSDKRKAVMQAEQLKNLGMAD